ncbi:MAG TPA: FHA domain-containing protein, partial [Bryobacterales bacterium]|nr:FHA domain-containing protein [Bryobacterales bacterium]
TQLMAQGLATQDPEAKVKIYTQILLLDPNNQVAYNARKDAEEALEKQNAAKNQQATQSSQKLEDTLERETVRRQSLQKVEQALLTGDIKTASAQMALAKQAAPNDPEVQRLDKVVGNLIEQKRRTTYLFSGAGLLVLLGLGAIVFLNRGEKDPYIEILNGLDKGRRYNLDKEVIRIGAVAQDGGEKNDIVVTDLERAVSRFHCDIVRQSGKFYLLDRKSANGTYIDGQRIPPGKPVRLKTGARVELGKSCALRLGMAKRKKK